MKKGFKKVLSVLLVGALIFSATATAMVRAKENINNNIVDEQPNNDKENIVDSVLPGQAFNVVWEVGGIDDKTGLNTTSDSSRRSTGFIETSSIAIDVDFENIYEKYKDNLTEKTALYFSVFFYDIGQEYLSKTSYLLNEDLKTTETPENTSYIRVVCSLFSNVGINATLDEVVENIKIIQN